MRRRLGLVLAVVLVVALLAGCSGGGLTDADFKIYDEDGNVTQEFTSEGTVRRFYDKDGNVTEEMVDEGGNVLAVLSGEVTSKKIGQGSTLEEVKQAYEGIEPARVMGDEEMFFYVSGDKELVIIVSDGIVEDLGMFRGDARQLK